MLHQITSEILFILLSKYKHYKHIHLIPHRRWMNNKQIDNSFLFGGGFLGMDNISCLHRSALPENCTLYQVFTLYTLTLVATPKRDF